MLRIRIAGLEERWSGFDHYQFLYHIPCLPFPMLFSQPTFLNSVTIYFYHRHYHHYHHWSLYPFRTWSRVQKVLEHANCFQSISWKCLHGIAVNYRYLITLCYKSGTCSIKYVICYNRVHHECIVLLLKLWCCLQ